MDRKVIFYRNGAGRKPVAEFMLELDTDTRAKCVSYLNKLKERGVVLAENVAKKVSGEIWELRPEWKGTEYRFFYLTFVDDEVYVVHSVVKKTQKLRPEDLRIAQDRAAEIRRRREKEG